MTSKQWLKTALSAGICVAVLYSWPRIASWGQRLVRPSVTRLGGESYPVPAGWLVTERSRTSLIALHFQIGLDPLFLEETGHLGIHLSGTPLSKLIAIEEKSDRSEGDPIRRLGDGYCSERSTAGSLRMWCLFKWGQATMEGKTSDRPFLEAAAERLSAYSSQHK